MNIDSSKILSKSGAHETVVSQEVGANICVRNRACETKSETLLSDKAKTVE